MFAVLYFRYAPTQLAADDIGWLSGQTPTVFDQYRVIPRASFHLLSVTAGANVRAAQLMVVAFHLLNAILVGCLARALALSEVASRIASVVFAINPVTLGTLTWVSCFSYVQGTTFALLALLAFRRGQQGEGWGFVGSGLAYLAALGCTHEVLFLPAVFLVLTSFEWRGARQAWPGLLVSAACTAAGLLVSHVGYGFDRFGVDSSGLLAPTFLTALLSSVISLATSLSIAYAASFAGSTTPLLQLCLSEPARWALTVATVVLTATRWRPTPDWRVRLHLGAAFMALVSPYVIRLYLTPGTVRYDPRYVLAGRVFYVAFVALALLLGELVAPFYARPGAAWRRWVGVALPLLAYGSVVLVAYEPHHFLGLNVRLGPPPVEMPRWNPYENDSFAVGAALSGGLLAIVASRVWTAVSCRSRPRAS